MRLAAARLAKANVGGVGPVRRSKAKGRGSFENDFLVQAKCGAASTKHSLSAMKLQAGLGRETGQWWGWVEHWNLERIYNPWPKSLSGGFMCQLVR